MNPFDQTYRALASPMRRDIVRRLALGRSLTVSEFAAPLPIVLPTVMPAHQKAETDQRAQLSAHTLTDMRYERVGCCFPSSEEHE